MKRTWLTYTGILAVGALLLLGGVVFGQPVQLETASPETLIVPAGGSINGDLYFPVHADWSGDWSGRVLVDSVAQAPADSIRIAWRAVEVTSSDTVSLTGFRAAAIDTNTLATEAADWILTAVGVGLVPTDSTWYNLLPAVPGATREPVPLLRTWRNNTHWEGVHLRVTVYGSENDTVAVHGEWRYRWQE
ncbi:hypothetical protein KQI63_15820 [bacterium]|nr:hypothetical protein [bacterium]